MNENLKILEEHGHLLLRDVLSPEQCQSYKNHLEEDFDKYQGHYACEQDPSSHGLENKDLEKVVFNLHNKSLAYFDLFDHSVALPYLDQLLKKGSYQNNEPYYLYNNSARCPLKGSPGQQLHLDSNLPGTAEFPLIYNVLWMLDDFTKDSGATRVLPGSHKLSDYAEDGKHYEEEILIEGSAGSVLIYNGALWHGGSANTSGADRWAVLLGYSRWFVKPSFDYMKNTPTEIFEQLSPERKELLGFNAVPPKDEFTRLRRRSQKPETPESYELPKNV